ncbi:MAG: hypothetical protein NT062_16855 [Proteobacteria bacterium]|nr:hypothetical protein [Pseudomonadota bacterium]
MALLVAVLAGSVTLALLRTGTVDDTTGPVITKLTMLVALVGYHLARLAQAPPKRHPTIPKACVAQRRTR